MTITPGSWVEVLPEYDIPEIARPDGKPSGGKVERVYEDGTVIVWEGGDGAAVPYQAHELRLVDATADDVFPESGRRTPAAVLREILDELPGERGPYSHHWIANLAVTALSARATHGVQAGSEAARPEDTT